MKMILLFSASALQIEQIPGPCHCLFYRFSQMRFCCEKLAKKILWFCLEFLFSRKMWGIAILIVVLIFWKMIDKYQLQLYYQSSSCLSMWDNLRAPYDKYQCFLCLSRSCSIVGPLGHVDQYCVLLSRSVKGLASPRAWPHTKMLTPWRVFLVFRGIEHSSPAPSIGSTAIRILFPFWNLHVSCCKKKNCILWKLLQTPEPCLMPMVPFMYEN